MKISEIFLSVQGEGPWIGQPCIFIRTAGCSLKCEWCDTKYAWEKGKNMKTDKILNEVNRIVIEHHGWIEHVVITGGEPFEKKELPVLVDRLMDEGLFVQIETNGLHSVKKVYSLKDEHYGITELSLVVSPKWEPKNRKFLWNSNNDEEQFDAFKIVMSHGEMFKQSYLHDALIPINPGKDKVWLMPCAWTRNLYLQEAPKVIKFCIESGYRFSPREHIVIWDEKRGV